MISGIYCIENLANNKRYIGSSCNINARLSLHLRNLVANKHHCHHLQRAWNKYGFDYFDIYQIIECPPDLLLFYEQQVLDELVPEYNTYKMAGSPRGYHHSDSAKNKVSKARKGIPLSDEHKMKLRMAKLGTHHEPRPASEETKRKISDTLKKKGIRPPTRLGWRKNKNA